MLPASMVSVLMSDNESVTAGVRFFLFSFLLFFFFFFFSLQSYVSVASEIEHAAITWL